MWQHSLSQQKMSEQLQQLATDTHMLPGHRAKFVSKVSTARSQLGEVLDVTKTEDKQPQLLIFTAKMAVLLQLAQVSFSFFWSVMTLRCALLSHPYASDVPP